MSAREEILERVRRVALHKARHPGAHSAPPLDTGWPAFARRLESVGGTPRGPVATRDLQRVILEIVRERAPDERVVAEPSAGAWIGPGPWQAASADAAPHSYEDVAIGIARGRLGCAENGAIAVAGSDTPSRALLVLCRHLVLLIPSDAILPDMHAAFARLPDDALAHHHLTWISGPSKTADIEQSLVYGAHGPLTLDVIAVDR